MLPSSRTKCGCMSLSGWAARSCFPAWLLMDISCVAAGGWTSCLPWAQDWPQSEAAEDSPHLKRSHEIDGKNGVLSLLLCVPRPWGLEVVSHYPPCPLHPL